MTATAFTAIAERAYCHIKPRITSRASACRLCMALLAIDQISFCAAAVSGEWYSMRGSDAVAVVARCRPIAVTSLKRMTLVAHCL